jgi:two-component system NarL family sensor kinase
VGQVLAAEETERRRLAEALHDEALQNLLFARQGFPAGISDKADRAQEAIGRTIEQLRSAIFDLHPAVLEHAGLEAALREVAERQAERAGFEAEIDVDPAACGPLDPLLFVLGREQLTNAAKHSGATEVEVVVARNDGHVVMEVSDNGCGLEDGHQRIAVEQGHIGLASSAERVEALGGELEIESPAGGGTRIRTILPLRSS